MSRKIPLNSHGFTIIEILVALILLSGSAYLISKVLTGSFSQSQKTAKAADLNGLFSKYSLMLSEDSTCSSILNKAITASGASLAPNMDMAISFPEDPAGSFSIQKNNPVSGLTNSIVSESKINSFNLSKRCADDNSELYFASSQLDVMLDSQKKSKEFFFSVVRETDGTIRCGTNLRFCGSGGPIADPSDQYFQNALINSNFTNNGGHGEFKVCINATNNDGTPAEDGDEVALSISDVGSTTPLASATLIVGDRPDLASGVKAGTDNNWLSGDNIAQYFSRTDNSGNKTALSDLEAADLASSNGWCSFFRKESWALASGKRYLSKNTTTATSLNMSVSAIDAISGARQTTPNQTQLKRVIMGFTALSYGDSSSASGNPPPYHGFKYASHHYSLTPPSKTSHRWQKVKKPGHTTGTTGSIGYGTVSAYSPDLVYWSSKNGLHDIQINLNNNHNVRFNVYLNGTDDRHLSFIAWPSYSGTMFTPRLEAEDFNHNYAFSIVYGMDKGLVVSLADMNSERFSVDKGTPDEIDLKVANVPGIALKFPSPLPHWGNWRNFGTIINHTFTKLGNHRVRYQAKWKNTLYYMEFDIEFNYAY